MTIKNVLNDSLYTGLSLGTDFNDRLVSLTIDSQEFPIHVLVRGQISTQLLYELKKFFQKYGHFSFTTNKICTNANQAVFSFPLLAMNLIKAKRKLSLLKSPTKSKCTPNVFKQKNQDHNF